MLGDLADPEKLRKITAQMISFFGSAVADFLRAIGEIADGMKDFAELVRDVRGGKENPLGAAMKVAHGFSFGGIMKKARRDAGGNVSTRAGDVFRGLADTIEKNTGKAIMSGILARPQDEVTEIPHAVGAISNLPRDLKASFANLKAFVTAGADKILNAKFTIPATPEAEFKQSAAKLAGSQEFLTAVNRHRFGAQRPDTPGEKQTTLMERMLEVLRAIEGKPPLEVKTFSKSAILHGNFGGTA